MSVSEISTDFSNSFLVKTWSMLSEKTFQRMCSPSFGALKWAVKSLNSS